jgi:hypothetical protein
MFCSLKGGKRIKVEKSERAERRGTEEPHPDI